MRRRLCIALGVLGSAVVAVAAWSAMPKPAATKTPFADRQAQREQRYEAGRQAALAKLGKTPPGHIRICGVDVALDAVRVELDVKQTSFPVETEPGSHISFVYGTFFVDDELQKLAELKQLRELSFTGSPLTNAGLVHLSKLTELRTLELGRTKITDAGLEHLANLTRLEKLDLVGLAPVSYHSTDPALAHLAGMTKLRVLVLTSCYVGDAGVERLKHLIDLEELRLDKTKITVKGTASLAGLTKLRKLNLENTDFGDDGLANLRGLTRLEELNLKRWNRGSRQFTDRGLEHLEGLTRLRKLNLYQSHITDEGLASPAKLTELRELDLSYSKVTAEGLLQLAPLKELEKLEVVSVRFRGGQNEKLRALFPKIKTIYHPGT